ncbi:MAG: hypothetical protein ACYCSO_06135 [Cuniculiplasma sp.]
MNRNRVNYLMWVFRYLAGSPIVISLYALVMILSFYTPATVLGEQEAYVTISLIILILLIYFSYRFSGIFERGEAFFYLNGPVTLNFITSCFLISELILILPFSLFTIDNSGILLSKGLFLMETAFILFYVALTFLIDVVFKNSYIATLTILVVYIFPLFTFRLFLTDTTNGMPFFALSPLSMTSINMVSQISGLLLWSLRYIVVVWFLLIISIKLNNRRDVL